MKLTIRNMSWFKRREPTVESKPVSVEVDDLQQVVNHKCKMHVLYDDDITYNLDAVVQVNHVGKWTVHGLNPHGKSCLVDIEW